MTSDPEATWPPGDPRYDGLPLVNVLRVTFTTPGIEPAEIVWDGEVTDIDGFLTSLSGGPQYAGYSRVGWVYGRAYWGDGTEVICVPMDGVAAIAVTRRAALW